MRSILAGSVLFLALSPFQTAAQTAWMPLGPEGGSVSELVIDPRQPSNLYASVGLGLYKSTDAGTTWNRILNRGAPAIVFEPDGPGIYSGSVRGIRYSNDGGATWTERSSGLIGRVTRMVIDPRSSSTLYAATFSGEGLHKTTDGGATWFRINEGLPFPNMSFRSLEIHPADPSTLYAGSESWGMFKTTDSGVTWFHSDTKDEFELEPAFSIYDIAIDPENPETVFYTATFNEPGASSLVFDDRIMQTTNGGNLWMTAHHFRADSRAIVFDPKTPTTLYATSATEGLFKSTDRGATWSLLGGPFLMSRLAVDPRETSTLYVGLLTQNNTAGGIYKSTDGGRSWAPAMKGLHGSRIFGVAIDPWDSANIFIIEDYLGVMQSPDYGQTWFLRPPTQRPDIFLQVLFDPLRQRILYIVALGSLYRSTDGGLTWAYQSEGVNGSFNGMEIDPIDSRTLYLSTERGVFKSTNRGANWAEHSEGLPLDRRVGSLEIDPRNPNTLYVALGADGNLAASALFKSTDGAESWTQILQRPETESIRHLRVDPREPSTVYAVIRPGGIFKSTNGGASFTEVSEGISDRGISEGIRDVILDPTKAQTLYVVTLNDGIYQTIDGGLSWHLWSDEALEPVNQTMTFDPSDPRNVYVGTLGNGLWTRNLGGCAEGPTRLCLNDERFEVTVTWRTPEGQNGDARTVPPPARSDSSGLFYFFSPENWEMLVKVLDGCAINGHYWVFAAATTNVEYTLRVTDTKIGEVWESTNPQGRSAPAITDAQAFATCM